LNLCTHFWLLLFFGATITNGISLFVRKFSRIDASRALLILLRLYCWLLLSIHLP
jgi:hypothetical protein